MPSLIFPCLHICGRTRQLTQVALQVGVGCAGPRPDTSQGDISARRRGLVRLHIRPGFEPSSSSSSCRRHSSRPGSGAGPVAGASFRLTTSSRARRGAATSPFLRRHSSCCSPVARHPSSSSSSCCCQEPLPGGAAPGPNGRTGQGSYPFTTSQSSLQSSTGLSSSLCPWQCPWSGWLLGYAFGRLSLCLWEDSGPDQ